jgi:omega-amidase
MKAHLVQMDIAWEDRAANLAIAEHLIREASPDPGDLVVLPEMFDSGFSLNVERTADGARETAKWIEKTAGDLGVFIQGSRTVGGVSGGKARNQAWVAGPSGFVCEYTKVHPFGFGGEAERFEGGSDVVTYEWGRGEAKTTVSPAICYDLRFPEFFRKGLALGAQVFSIGANWPSERAAHWRALLIARAIENQAFVLGVNRCGGDPRLQYSGGTLAVGPKGKILGELGPDQSVLTVSIDVGEVNAWRAAFPAWRDIRIESR